MGRALALLVAMLSLAAGLAVPAEPAGSEEGGGPAGLEGCEEGGALGGQAGEGRGQEGPDGGGEGGAPAGAAGGGRGWTAPDGIYWGNPNRLTDNGAEDRHPQLAASSNGNVGVVWGRGSMLMFMRINRTGAVQIYDKQITTGPVPVQASGFVPPYIGGDPKGSFHISFRPDTYVVAYAKYDADGNNLVPQKDVPSGASSPHAPSLAVSPNGIVHIVYEDCRFGYEEESVTYARLLNDGTIDKDGVRMSADGWMCSGSTACADTFNNVHSAFIVRGTSGLGAWHAKLDNFGNPLPQAPPRYMFNATTVGQFESVFPPTIHADATGAVHLAWNDRSQGIGRLMYMKLDNNGKKLAAGPDGEGIPLTISPTAKGFPSITSDIRGTAYVFWADNRNGNDQIYYVPVLPGRENDTELPNRAVCLDRDPSGRAKEPFAARDSDGNIRVVWSDNRDGNFEIYHVIGFPRGVEMGMTPEELYKVMYVHPEERRKANLTVQNPGGLNGTVHIDLAVNFHGHKGWNVSVEAADFEIGPNETRKIWVSVTGPPAGSANDYIDTRLTAKLLENTKINSSVAFRTYLLKDSRLKLECHEREKTTDPGLPARYSLLLQNIGDTNETAEVSVAGPPDWSWEVSPQKVRLDRKQACGLTLSVTPPASSSGQVFGVVKVSARAVSDPGIRDDLTVTTRLATWQKLSLTADRYGDAAAPGGTAVFVLTLDCQSNSEGPFRFLLEAWSTRKGAKVDLDSNLLMLGSDDAAYVVLSATIPADAQEGERLEVVARAVNEELAFNGTCRIFLTVTRIRALAVEAIPDGARLLPGGTAAVRLNIANAGNGPELILPAAFGLPAGWEAELSLPDGKFLEEGWNLTLGAGQTAEVLAQVSAPSSALAGRYPITARFTDGEGGPLAASADVEVLRVRSILVYGTDPTLTAEPGDSVRFPLVVVNRGNAPEELELACRGLPEGWPAAVVRDREGSPVTRATVPAHSGVNLSAGVLVPARTRLAFAGLEVLAGAGHDLAAKAMLTVEIELPDLAVVSVAPSKQYPRPGELVQVNVTVENRGRGTARGVVLGCHRHGEAVIDRELGDLGPGETRVESFIWIPREGKNILVFIVDPEDTVPEANETGNTALMKRYVSGPLPPGPDRSGWLAAGAAAVLAGAGGLAGLYALGLRRGRRR
jgi:uncharacterized membrane protein